MRINPLRHRQTAALALAICILFLCTLPVFAQGGFSVILYSPVIDQFPKVTLFVDAYDSQRKFIPGLDLNSFSVLEDGFEIPVNETILVEPGLHSIIAINLGATLSNRSNINLPTRFETVVFDLASWLNNLESSAPNQYSLTSNEGILVEKLQEKDAFTFQLQNYKPNVFNFEPDLTSLRLALDIAAKPNLIANSKQTVLYITPLPLDKDIPGIQSLEAQALEARVPVNVWLMAPDTAVNSPAAVALNQLSASTGGKFIIYTEQSEAPSPEEYFVDLRSIYRLRYTSSLNRSGTHIIRVNAKYGDQEASSQEVPFAIDLNLPSAVFIDMPTQIDRKYINTGNGRELQPNVVTLQADVIFPDGYSRQLEAVRLYVDGKLIAENTEEPFNFFGWPVDDYNFSGEHLISVEIQDILGFRSISIPRVVMVNVESLYPAWLTAFLKFFNRGGWILFAVIGLGGTFFTAARVRRRVEKRAEVGFNSDASNPSVDPLLQSVPGLASAGTDKDTFSYTDRTVEIREAAPYLQQVGSTPFSIGKVFEITDGENVIGSDAQSASFTLVHTSVNQRHAQIRRNPAGNVTISDLRSETGTWVNYTPISPTGVILRDGDLIKIGDFTFRYYLGLDRIINNS